MKPKPINTQWTDEQWEAIAIRDSNVLVSAGAGSGKTAVLSERVLELVREGVDVTDLIVLTFTNAAAAEMKERMRKKLIEDGAHNPLSLDSANKIDRSFITTFDSFCLYLVKKYNYILNVTQNISIIDSITASMLKDQVVNKVISDYVEKEDVEVMSLINSYSATSISEITSMLLSYYNSSIQNIADFELKDSFDVFAIYEGFILNKLNEIKEVTAKINMYAADTNLPEKIEERLSLLFNSNSYDEIHQTIETVFESRFWQLPRTKFDNKDLVKDLNNELKDQLKSLRANTNQSREAQIKLLDSNNQTKYVIKRILDEVEIEFSSEKKKTGLYEFIDINLMAIKLLKENPEICEYYKEHVYEIMIDEYQDTNDIQELFVSLIANNNVYMVGDIKQSIYGFRNANPKLFGSKFESYKTGNGGKLITLTNNFRSRAAVLDQVNNYFGAVMTREYGGITYDETQVMKYGNKSYELLSGINDNEIISYNSKDLDIDKSDFEIMQIFKDINNKLENGCQVVDGGSTRNVKLSDFAIICATREKFERIVQIGEFYNISVNADIQEQFSSSNEISVIQSIFNIANIVKSNNDENSKLVFSIMQLARSYIYDYTDSDIDVAIMNIQKIKETEVSKRMYSLEMGPLRQLALDLKMITNRVDIKSNSYILEQAITIFKLVEKLVRLNNPQVRQLRISKLVDLISAYDDRNYDLQMVCVILNNIEQNDQLDIEFSSIQDTETDSVNVITIHKSKGLEYNICYFPFLFKKFNSMDINSRYAYSLATEYILPANSENGNLVNTIEKSIFNDSSKQDLISEKIRLFYVAITRAKDRNILIVDNHKLEEEKVKPISKAGSMDDLVLSGWNQIKRYNQEPHQLTEREVDASNYNAFKQKHKNENKNVTPLNYKKLEINASSFESNRASGHISNFIDSRVATNIELGNEIHEKLEFANLFEIENEIDKSEGTYKLALENIKKTKLLEGMVNYYPEFQFKFIDEFETNGIIDLLVETEDSLIVIDYKLNVIEKDEYVTQVMTYVNYLKTISEKNIEGYLLSLLSGEVKKVY